MSSNEKLRKLELIEQQLCQSLQCAAQAFNELAKDKPNMKNVESQSNQFLKALESVDADISKQIAYLSQVSTGQPHEGSSYASMKALHMADHRLLHSRSRLNELERLKMSHQMQSQQHQQSLIYQQQMQTQSTHQSAHQSGHQSTVQSTHTTAHQSEHGSDHQSALQSSHQSTHQPSLQASHLSAHQSAHQSSHLQQLQQMAHQLPTNPQLH